MLWFNKTMERRMTAEILPGMKKADPETVQRLRISSFHAEEGVRRLAIVTGILLAAFSAYPMMGQWPSSRIASSR
jgi:hypothetical protein